MCEKFEREMSSFLIRVFTFFRKLSASRFFVPKHTELLIFFFFFKQNK